MNPAGQFYRINSKPQTAGVKSNARSKHIVTKRKKVIAVTGANASQTRALVQRLLQEPALQVRCVVEPNSDLTPLKALRGNLTLCEADITCPDQLDAALEGVWGVITLSDSRHLIHAQHSRLALVHLEPGLESTGAATEYAVRALLKHKAAGRSYLVSQRQASWKRAIAIFNPNWRSSVAITALPEYC